MNNIKIEDTKKTNQELSQVKGGALLLPAIQKVREAATRSGFTGGIRVASGDLNG